MLPSDSPWITLPDGRGLSAQPGDVVVVRCGWHHRAVTQVLPVADAAVFAEVVRTRATRVRGAPVAALPVEVDAPPPVQGHVPEVLPAPEPSGPPAYPVTGPGAPPRTGPGMAQRWGLGFPLALLGIVGVPVGLLLSGGLLPPETDLARYRLVFCALWTTLAAGIWLRSLRQPRYWPVWALTSGLATAIIVAVHGLGLPALLGPVVGVLLTWAGSRVLIRPVGTDLAGSRLEIPLWLPGGTALLVQHDRVVLTVGFRLVVAFPLAFLGTGLVSESIPRGAALGSATVVVAAALTIAAALGADWIRVRGRLRVAADNALPPGSTDWGELRPDHAPLNGWQPWWEGQG